MFSKLEKWIDRTDEDFLKDIPTHANQQKKIQKLRSVRLNFMLWIFFNGFVLLGMTLYIFFIKISQPFFVIGIGTMIPYILMISGFLICSINYSNVDFQIKMLLLYEKTQIA